MLAGFTLLLLCQLAGEALVKISDLPVPGPVVGMVLLTGLLASRTPLPGGLGGTAQALLGNLSLLFVPAGVGVVQNLKIFGSEGIRVVGVLILSTAITLVVTAAVFAGLARLFNSSRPDIDQVDQKKP
jgi:holin-like protein